MLLYSILVFLILIVLGFEFINYLNICELMEMVDIPEEDFDEWLKTRR